MGKGPSNGARRRAVGSPGGVQRGGEHLLRAVGHAQLKIRSYKDKVFLCSRDARNQTEET